MDLNELRRDERIELLRTLGDVGANAPTLCVGWSAADLAAHLVASERYAGVPLAISYPLRGVLPSRVVVAGMRSLQKVSQRQLVRAKAHGWSWLLERLAAGPPATFRWGSIGLVRLVEEWIHHEDIRRANNARTRQPSPDLDEALWEAATLLTGFAEFRPGRDGIEAVLPDGRTRRIGDISRARVEGTPGEILLFVAGRVTVAQVNVTGDLANIAGLNLAV
ncbi:MAG TPA: maleylpyruvate isomerase family mycothiol-dependent enzyme [Acidimicrobiales bacterium]